MQIKITTPNFTAEVDYPKYYGEEVEYMRGWSLDHMWRFCECRGWQMKIVSPCWKWQPIVREKHRYET